jgi:lysophospholipase L1-like esterase
MSIAILLVVLGAFACFEVAWIAWCGERVARPNIGQQAQTIGAGSPLTYVVLGDSTAVAQGGDYHLGYAMALAAYLGIEHRVTWANVAVSGARATDVATKQAPQAAAYKPDLALIAVGANDVTHLTNIGAARQSLRSTIAQLRKANPSVRIVLTGSPDMGAVPRLPQPLRWFAGRRTTSFNVMVKQLSAQQHVTFAPIAEKTGSTFRAHPGLFAADRFHPTTGGYNLWTPVLVRAVDEALAH